MNKSNWYIFKFVTGHAMVMLDDKWRMVMDNRDLIEQLWRMRTDKWGHNKPKEKKTYRMRINGEFKLSECNDDDCVHTGCKHFACYWANYVIEDIEIVEMKK